MSHKQLRFKKKKKKDASLIIQTEKGKKSLTSKENQNYQRQTQRASLG